MTIFDEPWLDDAACFGKDRDDWFPPLDLNASTNWPGTEWALLVCGSCPVKDPCYAYALEKEPHGTWGGSTAEERAATRRRQGRAPVKGSKWFVKSIEYKVLDDN
jgi:Transcription factor WhiB